MNLVSHGQFLDLLCQPVVLLEGYPLAINCNYTMWKIPSLLKKNVAAMENVLGSAAALCLVQRSVRLQGDAKLEIVAACGLLQHRRLSTNLLTKENEADSLVLQQMIQ